MADDAGLRTILDADNTRLKRKIEESVALIETGSQKMATKAQEAAARIDASFGKVTLDSFKASLKETAALQDGLNAARLTGDKAATTALYAELDVRQKVQKAQVAQLETQLALANATGSKKQAAELQELLAVYQRLRNLQGAGIVGERALGQAEEVAGALKGAEQANVGRAFQSVFDSARFATIEEGGAKLRIFGSALEPLGAYGLAAAAGVVALGEAMAQTHEAIEYADGLYRAAQAAHTTTTELQVMREALEKSGGVATEADGALLAFSETLGKAQAGLARSQRGFLALGFTAEQIKAFKDAPTAMEAVVEKIQKLRPQDQDAAIDLFGLKGLAPLILKGADAWKKYREEEVKDVLPPEVIARGHELAEQIDDLTRKIKNDLTEAFINLGPILVGILKPVEAILQRIKEFSDWVASHPAVGKLAGDVAKGAISGVTSGNPLGGLSDPIIARDIADLYHQTTTKAEFGGAKTITKEQLQDALGGPASGQGKLNDLADSAKESADRLIEAQKAALARAADELKARQALTGSIQLRAEIENQLADNALAQRVLDLRKQLTDARIDAAKGKIDKATLAQVESETKAALVSVQIVAQLTKELRDRQARYAQEDQDAETNRRERGARVADLQLQRGGATTLDDQNAIDRQILRAQQDQARQDLATELARQQDNGELSPEEATRRRNAQLQEQADASAALDRQQVGRFLADAEARRQDAVAAQADEIERARAHADSLAGLADTLDDRTKFERQSLDRAQERDRLLADAEIDRAKADAAAAINAGDPKALRVAQDRINSAVAARDALPGQQRDQDTSFDRGHENPIEQYARSVRDLKTAVQGDAVSAFKDLTSGIIDAAIHAKNAGDVIRNVFLNLAQQILTQALQKEALPGLEAAGSALLHLIPGFADGTIGAPGGLALVGERGPELVNLPMGAQVYDSFKTMRTLNGMAMPKGQPTYIAGPTFVLNNPVTTQDLLNQMNAISAANSRQAAQAGRSLAVKDVQRAGYMGNLNQ